MGEKTVRKRRKKKKCPPPIIMILPFPFLTLNKKMGCRTSFNQQSNLDILIPLPKGRAAKDLFEFHAHLPYSI